MENLKTSREPKNQTHGVGLCHFAFCRFFSRGNVFPALWWIGRLSRGIRLRLFPRGVHFDKTVPALYDDGEIGGELIKKKKAFCDVGM